MTIALPDGTIVELCLADSYSGPDNCFSRLHVNSTALFFRINNDKWKKCYDKSLHKVKELIKMCDSIEDLSFLEM